MNTKSSNFEKRLSKLKRFVILNFIVGVASSMLAVPAKSTQLKTCEELILLQISLESHRDAYLRYDQKAFEASEEGSEDKAVIFRMAKIREYEAYKALEEQVKIYKDVCINKTN